MNDSAERCSTPPLIYNPHSGSSQRVLDALSDAEGIQLISVSPEKMHDTIADFHRQGHQRLAVCGGDGTLALAAGAIVQHPGMEMAVIPGGTLNHFASRTGIPLQPSEAWHLACHGTSRSVDVGSVNGHLFLNTSSVGAYVTFVRQREYLEKRMSYTTASIIAGIRRLLRWRRVRLSIDGEPMKSPLVFVGLHERELRLPALGQPRQEGRRGLHVFAIQTRNALETINLVARAMLLGTDPLHQDNSVRTSLTDTITINCRKSQLIIAVDGELIKLNTPLEYRFQEGKLLLVC